MVLTEFDEEKFEAMIREEEREEGRREGLQEGIKEGQLRTLISLVSDEIISMEEAERRLEMTAQEFQEAIQSLKLN